MCSACFGLPHRWDARPGREMGRRGFVATAAVTGGLFAAAAGPAPAPATPATADLLIENAKIITLDPAMPSADAIAVAGDSILRVGARRDLQDLVGPATRTIDAGGRTVVPGLNDSHTHFIRGGLTYAQELRWDGVPSLGIALQMLRDQAQRTPAPNWVQVVGGWTGGAVRRAAAADARRDQRGHGRGAGLRHAHLRPRLHQPRGPAGARLQPRHAQPVRRHARARRGGQSDGAGGQRRQHSAPCSASLRGCRSCSPTTRLSPPGTSCAS